MSFPFVVCASLCECRSLISHLIRWQIIGGSFIVVVRNTQTTISPWRTPIAHTSYRKMTAKHAALSDVCVCVFCTCAFVRAQVNTMNTRSYDFCIWPQSEWSEWPKTNTLTHLLNAESFTMCVRECVWVDACASACTAPVDIIRNGIQGMSMWEMQNLNPH